ncbi:MAG: NRDE family protein [Bacteroidetes bacterium]|nr:NRDE family protein [Bacteroidota bacterium]
MCTVTFVRSGDKFILTSNRDEQTSRPASSRPELYSINQKNIYFPRDPKAGGTWFAIDEHANVAVLLNGAFTRHTIHSSYTRSRGLILLDIISQDSPLAGWHSTDLTGMEPFTLIVLENGKLYQMRWDYSEKHLLSLDEEINHIWSSVTLYTTEIINQRKNWFHQFQMEQNYLDEKRMQYFHMHTGGSDKQNGLIINRDNVVKTQSITQAVVEKNKVSLFYHDIIKEESHTNSFLML